MELPTCLGGNGGGGLAWASGGLEVGVGVGEKKMNMDYSGLHDLWCAYV